MWEEFSKNLHIASARFPDLFGGNLSLVDLDRNSNAEWVLGRQLSAGGRYPENRWVDAHAQLLSEQRRSRNERGGYTYLRDGIMCKGGIVIPSLCGEKKYEDMGLGHLVQDAPYTLLLSPGERTIPLGQNGRQEFVNHRMKDVKNAVVIVGGLLENRLALEGIGVEIMKGLDNPEQTALFLISHSGAEQSYWPKANLKTVNWVTELATIDASVKRLMQVYSLDLTQIKILLGHSKGGFFVEQMLNGGEYPNASGVEYAPAIMGTELSAMQNVDEWPDWIKSHTGTNHQHVIVQTGGYNAIINFALYAPEMRVRTALVKLLGPIIAEHFVGSSAAFRDEAVYAIEHELRKNKKAIIAQQRSLHSMPMIVADMQKASDNARYIVAAGEDKTLMFAHQWAYKIEMARKLRLIKKKATQQMFDLSKHESESPHNVSPKVLDDSVVWINNRINHSEDTDTGKDPAGDFVLAKS